MAVAAAPIREPMIGKNGRITPVWLRYFTITLNPGLNQLIEQIRTEFADGSIPFAEDGLLAEDNANFAWDNINKVLDVLAVKLLGLIPGSVPFIDDDNILAEDNANLFWDIVNKTLQIPAIENPNNILKLQGCAANNIELFGDAKIVGFADSRRLKLWRKSAGTDHWMDFFIQGNGNARWSASGSLVINNNLVMLDNKITGYGSSSDYKLFYDSANLKFVIRSSDVNGAGLDGNIMEMYTGTPNVNFIGNVGIGATTPEEKLDVAGIIKSEGRLKRRVYITPDLSPYSVQIKDEFITCDTDISAIILNLPEGTNGEPHKITNIGDNNNNVDLVPFGLEEIGGENITQKIYDNETFDISFDDNTGWWL